MSALTPTPVVQFAFGLGPLDDPSAAWVTPSSAKVTIEHVSIERGRTSEFDDFPPSTCTISIRDGNRIFDPSNAAGPYYGNLKPRVWVRVRGFISPTYYDRFTGYVDGWPLQNGRGLATVNLTATDAQKILASKRLPQSVYETVIEADAPVGYWKLGETTGEVAADFSGNDYDGTYQGVLNRGVESVVPYSVDGSMKSVANSTGFVQLPFGARIDARPITVEMWLQTDTKDPLTPFGSRKYLYLQPQYEVTREGFLLSLGGDSDTDQFLDIVYVGPVYNFETSFAADVNDGAPHHVVFTLRNLGFNGFAECYVDGHAVTHRDEQDGGYAPLLTPDPSIGGGTNSPGWVGRQDDVAIYDVELSASQITAHYIAGTAPWDGDSTGARITRVLDLIGWPAGMRAIDGGEMILGPANLEGRTALDYLKSVAASEQGRLFVDASGKVTFHSRGRYITEATETTSQFVFSDDGAGDGVYQGLNFTLDETKIVNGADVSRDGGSVQHAEDSASQDDYGPVEKSISGLLLRHDRDARQIAETLVYRYKTPQTRAEGWSLQPEMDANSWPDVLGLEIGHRVTLECKPVNVGSQIVIDQHLERVRDDITPSTWTIEFNGSPTDPNLGLYFTFDGVGATQGFDHGVFR